MLTRFPQFISFAAAEFSIPAPTSGDPNLKVLDEQTLDTRARRLAQKHGVQAYWCDYHCRALQQPEATDSSSNSSNRAKAASIYQSRLAQVRFISDGQGTLTGKHCSDSIGE